jgi:hypothetical protein
MVTRLRVSREHRTQRKDSLSAPIGEQGPEIRFKAAVRGWSSRGNEGPWDRSLRSSHRSCRSCRGVIGKLKADDFSLAGLSPSTTDYANLPLRIDSQSRSSSAPSRLTRGN